MNRGELATALCAIAHMQVGAGVWYSKGGTRAVPAALARLGQVLGVTLRAGADVHRLLIDGGGVQRLEMADGERIALSAVVSNMDSVRTYRELVGGDAARLLDRGRRREPACSRVVFYLGLDRAYEHLQHHNFVFLRNPEEEFDWIYRRGEPAPDPTCYVAAPVRTELGPATAAANVGGLSLAGGAAHPGRGIPMVLMSGWVAADAFDQDLRRRAAA
jgi:diapolycopene oxygenase